MAFGRSSTRRRAGGATVTTTVTTVEQPHTTGRTRGTRAVGAKPTLGQRLFGTRTRTPRATTAPTTTRRRRVGGTRATAAPRRKTSMSDKVSGAMLKLKGSLTHRPGQKAAGTRRMHGTDGRGSRRYY